MFGEGNYQLREAQTSSDLRKWLERRYKPSIPAAPRLECHGKGNSADIDEWALAKAEEWRDGSSSRAAIATTAASTTAHGRRVMNEKILNERQRQDEHTGVRAKAVCAFAERTLAGSDAKCQGKRLN